MAGVTGSIFVAHNRLSGFAEHSALIACRGSLVNNTSTANSETPAPEVLLDA
jgi:hypothetical protein